MHLVHVHDPDARRRELVDLGGVRDRRLLADAVHVEDDGLAFLNVSGLVGQPSCTMTGATPGVCFSMR